MVDDSNLTKRRRQRAVTLMTGAGLDALAFVPGPNFLYLTGLNFHLMERPTLLILDRGGDITAIMPALERLKWSTAFPHATTFYWQDSDGFESAFADAAAALGAVSVGVEGGRMRMFEYDALRNQLKDGAVSNADTALAVLRMVKDADEIALLEAAIAISEVALEETVEAVRPGMTEKQVKSFLESRMLANGADGFSFDPIVLAGGKAANPHGTPDDTSLKPGDAMLMDFGARIGGYNADITRTFFVGHVRDEHADIYGVVKSANAVGRDIAIAGMTAHDLDTQVTARLRDSPFADLIVHKTGHGLGLDVHEAPQVMIGNRQRLDPGTVITIEPGLYRAGDVGVRIEDDVVMTAEGARSLTGFDRHLRVIG
ncbi:MAG: Xaa-Pro peptidase family protein [Paracoccaceae bacterium]|nr:Xaa-Pro peptidase family protein [Paracoccaceae bacterium]